MRLDQLNLNWTIGNCFCFSEALVGMCPGEVRRLFYTFTVESGKCGFCYSLFEISTCKSMLDPYWPKHISKQFGAVAVRLRLSFQFT